MAAYGTPTAEQIISLNGDKVVLNTDSLRKILSQDAIRGKPVCVVSITGAFRQGKSFILNFFVRYLHVKYKKKINATRWLDPADGPISGFPWRSGSERHTVGILMWSEVFLAELPSGEEIAIILLDTQGSFDNASSVTSCAAIFALSTLISSVQIYNLKENIKQYDLSHLECFSGYGQLAGDFNNDTPFQNLLFLIRDWPWPHEKEYGARGGQQLIDQILYDNGRQPPELVAQIKNIRQLFKKINCFLLPHPGFTVASTPEFGGNLEDIDAVFKKQIEEFMPAVLAPENLIPKTINGEKIKVEDLLHFVESYCQHFQSGKMPSLNSMFKATSDAQHAVALKEAEAIYEKAMYSIKNKNTKSWEEHVLLDQNRKSKEDAFRHFRKKKMMGNKEIKEKYESLLAEKLEQKFLEYKSFNDAKREKEQYNIALIEAELAYEKDMDDIKQQTFRALRKDEFLEKDRRCQERAWGYFNGINGSEEMKNKYKSLLESKLRKKSSEYASINYVKYQKEQEVERETQLRREQQLENERRMKEEREKHKEKLRKEKELREEERQRLEQERQRQEQLRIEEQRVHQERLHEERLLREEERRQEEKRLREQEAQHQRRIDDERRLHEEKLRREQELREEQQRRMEEERRRQEEERREQQRLHEERLREEQRRREEEREEHRRREQERNEEMRLPILPGVSVSIGPKGLGLNWGFTR